MKAKILSSTMEQNLFPWLILITRLNSENLYQQLKKQKTNENAAG